MNSRIRQVVSQFDQLRIDALLVPHEVNVTYLTQFFSSESWLLIFPKKSYYITDFRYVLEARQGLKGIRVYPYVDSIIAAVFRLMCMHKVKRLGFDERHISLFMHKNIKQVCPRGIRMVKANFAVERLREVKEKSEIEQIRECLRLHFKALQYLKGVIKPGITEYDAFFRLEKFVKSRRARFSFDPIVASGPNSCFPHASVTDRKIRNNEPVLIDMGIDLGGYKSDLTRMFFLGKIPPLVREVNHHVDIAQKRAIAKIRSGISACDVDSEARNYLKSKKLAKYFNHSLGHGVGLDIHESPRLSHNNPAVLREGMVITVEPAVYIPHQFGIRIEDMVLVSKDGCKVLSN